MLREHQDFYYAIRNIFFDVFRPVEAFVKKKVFVDFSTDFFEGL